MSTDDQAVKGLGDVLAFMRLLWSLDHALQKTSKRMAARIGVTGPQRLVLRIVGRCPGLTAGHLASVLQIDPSTLTGILARLEEGGLIHRRPDPGDRRRVLLRLSARGKRLDRSIRGTVEYAVKRVLDRTGARELRSARKTLSDLVSSLDSAL